METALSLTTVLVGLLFVAGLLWGGALAPVRICGSADLTAGIPKSNRNLFARSETTPFLSVMETRVREEFLDRALPRHSVRAGETLYSLSQYYFVSLSSLAGLNRIAHPENLEVGRVLHIPPVDFSVPTLKHYRLKPGDTATGIMGVYNLQLYQLQRLNPNVNLRNVADGSELVIPSRPLPPRQDQYAGLRFIRPVMGFLTSRYGFRWGRMHYGVDLAAPTGTPVKAASAGHIEFSGWLSGYGLFVKVNHGRYSTSYGHLSKSFVVRGMRVGQGQMIGLVGATGRAYGSHLHFEIEQGGKKVNPYGYLYR